MKNRILLSIIVLMIISMTLIPFAYAKNWEPKNNDKFQLFSVQGALAGGTNVEFSYYPNEEDPNLVKITMNEVMTSYEITVGSNTYYMGTDFEYNGFITWTLFDPEPPIIMPAYLNPSRSLVLDVKYSYTFLPASGLEGTINMHALAKGETIVDLISSEAMLITSKQCTGDFQNVNIKATTGGGGVVHMGTVIGWPE